MKNFRLDGQRILVTGAGRGLGKAIADGLSDLGGTVYGTSRDEQVAQEISERYSTAPLSIDLTDIGSFPTFVDKLQRLSGGINMLVNNAGVNIPKPAVDVSEEDWNTVVDTNLKGSFFLSAAFAREWLRTDTPGAIVNIASQAGIVAIEERVAYGTSKAGLIHLTKALALEWAQKKIRVNAVAPTFVLTELTKSTLSRPDWAADLRSRIPMGRFGEPEEIVGAVAFLLSEAASLITGHTITIDGGYTIR